MGNRLSRIYTRTGDDGTTGLGDGRRVRKDDARVAAYGTVDEANRTLTYNIVSASFPNWQGEAQTRAIDKLTSEEFVNTNRSVAGGRGSASNFYRRVK